VMIAVAAGARVLASDVSPSARALARRLGAEVTLDPGPLGAAGTGGAIVHDHGGVAVGEAVRDATGGGAQLSLDALGSAATCAASIAGLATRGRHVQVGLLPPGLGWPPVPMHLVIARELAVLGSHGMAAHAYPQLLALVASGRLRPQDLITARLTLEEAGPALFRMNRAQPAGVAVAAMW